MASSRSVASPRSATSIMKPSLFSCNKCFKPMKGSFFVCACDCAFCEVCAINHFQRSSKCPKCGQVLSSNDFVEFGIASPSEATKEHPKMLLQYVMTKFSAKNKALTHQEMCSRLLQQLDTNRRAVRFMLKQFVGATAIRDQIPAAGDRDSMQSAKQEISALKQQLQTLQISKQHELTEKDKALKVMKNNYNELVKQNQQFRQMLSSGGSSRSVRSGSGSSAGGNRGPRSSTPSNVSVVQEGPPGGDRGPRFDRQIRTGGHLTPGIPRQVAVVHKGPAPRPVQQIPPHSPSGRSASSTIASIPVGYRFRGSAQSMRSGVTRFGGIKRHHSASSP